MEATASIETIAVACITVALILYGILEWFAQKRITNAHARLNIAGERIKNAHERINEQVAITQLLKEEIAILRKGNKDLTACLEEMKREFEEMNNELDSLSRAIRRV